jgi:hypothetical protein
MRSLYRSSAFNMARRTDFGANWGEVVQEWCLGNRPSIDEKDAWQALGVLERLWPDRLEQALSSSARGPLIIVELVEAGLSIDACEDLEGFPAVFERLKHGEPAASSELRFAAALVGLGYAPILEPSLNGKRLDARISVGGDEVYVEVSTPAHSEAARLAWEQMKGLCSVLTDQNPGVNLSVCLLTDPSSEVCDEVAGFAQTLTPTPRGSVAELPGVAWVRSAPGGVHLPPLDALAGLERAPRIFSTTAARVGGIWGQAEVSLPFTDHRAEQIMHRELTHFSRHEVNLLVIFVSQVIGGVKQWVPLVERRFQPTMNRRCGAVVLVGSVALAVGPAIQLTSHVLVNPHAYKRVPPALLDKLGRLPNWWCT